jgi:hypothetical protein
MHAEEFVKWKSAGEGDVLKETSNCATLSTIVSNDIMISK